MLLYRLNPFFQDKTCMNKPGTQEHTQWELILHLILHNTIHDHYTFSIPHTSTTIRVEYSCVGLYAFAVRCVVLGDVSSIVVLALMPLLWSM